MPLLIASFAVLCAIILCGISPAFSRRRKIIVDDIEQQNAEIAHTRLAELSDTAATETVAVGSRNIQSDKNEIYAALATDLKAAHCRTVRVPATLSRQAGYLIFLGLLTTALVTYSFIGNPQMSDTEFVMQQSHPAPADIDIDTLIAELEQRLKEQPENIQGWELAARAYMGTTDYVKAEYAFATLNRLRPGNPDYLAGWADAEIVLNGDQYTAKARDRIEKALRIDPRHTSALWISGFGESSLGNHQAAIRIFQTLLPLVDEDAEAQARITALIDQHQALLSARQPATSHADQSISPRTIAVHIDFGPQALNMAQTGFMFLIARALNGPPAPLAVIRLPMADAINAAQPFTLTAAHSMMADFTIDSFDDIAVYARVSATGNAQPGPDDLTSEKQPARFGEDPSDNKKEIRITLP